MINVVININEIIIRDVSLSFNVEKFFEKFANICVAFLIDFFFRIQLNDFDKEVARFNYFYDFFKFASNNTTFSRNN